MNTLLHSHCGNKIFDAVADKKDYLVVAKEKGYDKIAVTDHGTLNMLDMYAIAKKVGIKLIYGVEAYIEVPPFKPTEKLGHLILMAKDEEGAKILRKLISKGEQHKGESVIMWDKLINTKFEGHVIAQSACVAGAPALKLMQNDIIEKNIIKFSSKLNELDENGDMVCLKPDDKKYQTVLINLSNLENRQIKLRELRDSKSLEAERRIHANLSKDLQKKGEDASNELAIVSNYDTKIANLKSEINNIKIEISDAKKELEPLKEAVNKYVLINERIENLRNELKTEEELKNEAKNLLVTFNNIFGQGNYFVEIQYHGIESEAKVYPILVQLAKELNIPLCASNDVHIPTNEEKYINMRNVAKFLRFTNINESDADKELYIKTPDELKEMLVKIIPENLVDEAIANNSIIGDMCTYEPKKENHYPVFDKTRDSKELLWEECIKGVKWRFTEKEWTETYKNRLKYEYEIITNMGYADYFLIVKDFLEYGRLCGYVPMEKLPEVPLTMEGAKKYCQEHGYDCGIGIGLGRGSGAGSLVTYVLGITSVDPIKRKLSFERFLNPDRVTMPKQYWAFSVNSITQRCA